MRVALIWIIWLALVVWWLSPGFDDVRDNVSEHNTQIEKTINE
jgi:hypothetical protein